MTGMLYIALVGGLLAFAWKSNVEARTVANQAAYGACERDGLQLLDGTVAFKSWRTGRDRRGRLALLRTYVFDYSDDGTTRRHGFVVLRGRDVEIVGLGPTLVHERVA